MILGFILFFSVILIPFYYEVIKDNIGTSSGEYSAIKEAENILKNNKDKRDDKQS